MATNDFLPFAVGAGANVLSQTDYAAQTAIASGYSAGIAKSAALNKTWRQSSIMAAVLAQFISDQTGANSTDDGTTATLLANLKRSMPGRLLRTSVYINTAGTLQVSIDGAAFVNASSTFTPLSATSLVQVQVQASGGAGGGGAVTSGSQVAAGSGGGAGGYARKRMTTGFSGVTVTVGGAATGVSGGSGNSGSSSSFGAAVSATGGTGGSLGTALSPTNQPAGGAAGGTGSGGDINVTGGQGQYAIYNAIPVSGKGGFAMFGDGAPPTVNTAGGTASSNYGAAGSGGSVAASSGPAAGGASKSGVVIIEEFA